MAQGAHAALGDEGIDLEKLQDVREEEVGCILLLRVVEPWDLVPDHVEVDQGGLLGKQEAPKTRGNVPLPWHGDT